MNSDGASPSRFPETMTYSTACAIPVSASSLNPGLNGIVQAAPDTVMTGISAYDGDSRPATVDR